MGAGDICTTKSSSYKIKCSPCRMLISHAVPFTLSLLFKNILRCFRSFFCGKLYISCLRLKFCFNCVISPTV